MIKCYSNVSFLVSILLNTFILTFSYEWAFVLFLVFNHYENTLRSIFGHVCTLWLCRKDSKAQTTYLLMLIYVARLPALNSINILCQQ